MRKLLTAACLLAAWIPIGAAAQECEMTEDMVVSAGSRMVAASDMLGAAVSVYKDDKAVAMLAAINNDPPVTKYQADEIVAIVAGKGDSHHIVLALFVHGCATKINANVTPDFYARIMAAYGKGS